MGLVLLLQGTCHRDKDKLASLLRNSGEACHRTRHHVAIGSQPEPNATVNGVLQISMTKIELLQAF